MSKMSQRQFRGVGDQQQFFERIRKTLYYGKLPSTERLSLPVTELAAELFSEPQSGRSLDRLHGTDAAKISRNACVSPCSLILAMLYLEQLKNCNPEYLQRVASSELFLVSLMISSKFLHDDGEEDEVFIDEWASSGGISIKHLIQLEKEFLQAINWEIFVYEETFWKKLFELEAALAKKEGCNRGWFTYTELQNLLVTVDIQNLIQVVAVVTSVLLTAYFLAVLTVLGSVLIVSNLPGNCLQSRQEYLRNHNYMPFIRGQSQNNNLKASEDYKTIKNINKSMDAADVLKASIILASIKTTIHSKKINKLLDNTEVNSTVTNDSWAWWTNPTMEWLTKTSQMLMNYDYIPEFKFVVYNQYNAMSMGNFKLYELEDHIHKATKVRIQDQMERSWHKEWTDTLRNIFLEYKLLSYS